MNQKPEQRGADRAALLRQRLAAEQQSGQQRRTGCGGCRGRRITR